MDSEENVHNFKYKYAGIMLTDLSAGLVYILRKLSRFFFFDPPSNRAELYRLMSNLIGKLEAIINTNKLETFFFFD